MTLPTDITDFTFPQVCEFYLTQLRQTGSMPNIEELVRNLPHMEEEIRSRLPAIGLLEQTRTGRKIEANSTKIGGCFVDGTLSPGPHGIVYLGYRQQLDHRVAIKVIEFHDQPKEAVEAFAADRKAIAKLQHPNIAPTFNYVHDKEVGCLITKLVDGYSLDQILNGECDHRGLYLLNDLQTDWKSFAKLAKTIASGLNYAHERAVIHGNLKPSNILLDKNGNPRITDFGFAALRNSDEETSRYRAPEQFEGQRDLRSDIYAIGLTLYDLASSDQANSGQAKSHGEIDRSKPIVDIRKINPNVPVDLAKIIMKACMLSPNDRYQTANEMGVIFDRFEQGLVADRRCEDRPSDEAYKTTSRKKMATKMIGACLLAMMIAGLCILGAKTSFLNQTKSLATDSVAAIQSKWATKKTSATNKASATKNALANKTFAAIQKKSASEKASASKKISTRKNGLESKDALAAVQKTFSTVKASSVKPISPTKGNGPSEPSARRQSKANSAINYGPITKRPSYQEDDSLVVRANPSTSSTRGQQLLSSIQTSSMPEAEKAKSQQTLRRFSTAIENGLISAEQANQRFNLLDKNGTMNKVGEKRVRAWLKLIRRDVAKLGRTRPVPESTTTKNVSQPSSKSKEELRQILLNGNLLDLQ